MERALKHKFTVGETVYFTGQQCRASGRQRTYEVIRLLPTDGDDCQYRIKNSTEAFERVAKESQLDVLTNSADSRRILFRPPSKGPFAETFCEKLSAEKKHSLSSNAFTPR